MSAEGWEDGKKREATQNDQLTVSAEWWMAQSVSQSQETAEVSTDTNLNGQKAFQSILATKPK